MELSLEPLSTFRPRTGGMEAWNAAYVRVEDYLRAHRIHNRLHQSRLIQRILNRAAARHEANPALDPTTLAAEETERMMDDWFGKILAGENLPADRVAPTGRVALLLADGPAKWPYAFLDDARMPPDFTAALRRCSMEAGPDLAVSSMVPRPIDLGLLSGAAGETLERIEKWPVLRTLALWALFLAALALIFSLTR